MIEFKKTGTPDSPAEVNEQLSEIRESVKLLGSKDTEERVKKVQADVTLLFEKAEDAAKRANEALESAKAAHEAGRTVTDNSTLAAGLRSLGRPHGPSSVEGVSLKDSDATRTMLSILLTKRGELVEHFGEADMVVIDRVRKLNDACVTFDHWIRMKGGADFAAYQRAGGITSTSVYKQFQEAARALDTATAAASGNWVPSVVYSSNLWEDVRLAFGASNLFNWIDMPMNNWTLPTLTHTMVASLLAESTEDNSTSWTSQDAPTSGKVTLTAKKHGVIVHWSREIDQDSIVPVLPMLQRELAYCVAEYLEHAVLNGQSSAGIDSGYTGAATDVRASWDGLRKLARTGTLQVDFGGVVNAESLAQMIGKAGKYANPMDCAFVTSYAGLARTLVAYDKAGGTPLFMRADAAGAGAGFNPSIGSIMGGYPLVVSGRYPSVDATGVVNATGASNTKTGFLFFNKNLFLAGRRQGLQIESSTDFLFDKDLFSVKATARWAFTTLLTPSTTNTFVVEGINIPNF